MNEPWFIKNDVLYVGKSLHNLRFLESRTEDGPRTTFHFRWPRAAATTDVTVVTALKAAP